MIRQLFNARSVRALSTSIARRQHSSSSIASSARSLLAQTRPVFPTSCAARPCACHTGSSIRHNSTAPPPGDSAAGAAPGQKVPIGKVDKPQYQLTFTCKKCTTRSSHQLSKQAYHKGTVLIQCPGCKNRHLIADHLKVRPTNLQPTLYFTRYANS